MAKKYFKCGVCGDIHFGEAGPEICPTCNVPKSYELVDRETAKKAMGL
jgi:rubrerythrin